MLENTIKLIDSISSNSIGVSFEDVKKELDEAIEYRKKYERLLEESRILKCKIDGCINHSKKYENCCSRYRNVNFCADAVPHSKRIR